MNAEREESNVGAAGTPYRTIEWSGGFEDGCVRIIDQRLLPAELRYEECRDVESIWRAIRQLRVRGAPAIGIAAAMGLVLAARSVRADSAAAVVAELERAAEYLRTSRPTAVNLFWAIERMLAAARRAQALPAAELKQRLWSEALAIAEEDRRMCRSIGRHGAPLVPDGAGVLTHCNAGGLATAEYGTALAVLFAAKESGKRFQVYVDETRPLLQGARLTAWELMQHGIDTTLICDNMAADLMRRGRVQMVVVGADRIAANGDVANKIGTYSLAVLAQAHGVPFYVAAPASTFDLATPTGSAIPIEQRPAEEVTRGALGPIAPAGVRVYNPAFDVTPAHLIRAIITDRGLVQPVTGEQIKRIVANG